MDVSIDIYQANDFGAVLKLMTELQQYESEFNVHRTTDAGALKEVTQAMIDDCVENDGMLLLAKVNEKCVGLIAFYPDKDILNAKEHLYISDLIVTKEHRNQGVAQTLMTHAEAFAKDQKISVIRVGVLAESPTLDFYTKRGFLPETVELVKEL